MLPGISVGAQIREKWKELCAYVLPCVASAAVMFTYLLSYMTPQKMLEMAGEILGEGSHQTTVGEKLLGWGSSLGEMAMILLCALLVSLGIRWFIEKVWKKNFPDCYSFRACCFS